MKEPNNPSMIKERASENGLVKLPASRLVGLAVGGGANFLDPFEKHIRPFVKGRLVNILRAGSTQSSHLFLIHHVEACYAEDRFHCFTIQTRQTLDHEVLGFLQDLLVTQQRRPQFTVPRVQENSLGLICVENAPWIGAKKIKAASLFSKGRAEVMHINHGLSTDFRVSRLYGFPLGAD